MFQHVEKRRFKMGFVFIIVHFKIEVAAKIFKRFAIFNNWQKFSVDEKFRLKL